MIAVLTPVLVSLLDHCFRRPQTIELDMTLENTFVRKMLVAMSTNKTAPLTFQTKNKEK